MPEQSQADGGLAGAGLAHQAHHLTRVDREADVVHDVAAASGQLDAQSGDDDGRGVGGDPVVGHPVDRPRSMPAAAREMPSPTSPVPTVSRAIAITGSTTPHGCAWTAIRFWLIMVPQLAPFVLVANPRNASPAISPIE